MYIKRFYDEEDWVEFELKEPFDTRFKLFVSNYGNLKKHNLITNTTVNLKQPKTEGFPSFNISFTTPLAQETKDHFAKIRLVFNELGKQITLLNLQKKLVSKELPEYKKIALKVKEELKLFNILKENYTNNYTKSLRANRNTFGGLTHRFVALLFISKPSDEHKFVGHLDHDKENNHHSNLKWMTLKENVEHNKNNPLVITAKLKPKTSRENSKTTKLSTKDVMIIKKRINEGIQLSKLAKRYPVTETQLLRIKRGINWGSVPAAL